MSAPAACGLSRLFRPRSIAVFGGAPAEAVIVQCRRMGFEGEIWPVHPTRRDFSGLRAFASVDELPGIPDACFIGVNRASTVAIVRRLAEIGSGGAVAYAAGFSEVADGAGLEAELVEAAGAMALIGPNCYGLINYADGVPLWPDQHGGRRLRPGERGAALVLQSSNIAINLTMQRRGLPIAFVVTAGNQAQTGISDLALALIEDERVSTLGLHVEGFDQVVGFERLAERARELAKPVIAIKVGRSEAARAAAVSHTASLSGSDSAASAFLDRIGIARLDSLPSFLEALKLLHVHGPLAGRRLSSMSCSGGEAALVADAAQGRRAGFAALDEARRTALRRALGPLPAIANPLDYHTFVWNDPPAMTGVFRAMTGGDFDLNLLVLDFPRRDRCEDRDWRLAAECFAVALGESGARGAIVATLPENLGETEAEWLLGRGIAPMLGIGETLEAIDAAVTIGEAWTAAPRTPMSPVQPAPGKGRLIDEAEAKELMARAGLPVPPGRRVRTPDEAVEAAIRIGFPVALKAIGLAHKSEHGAVRLGLESAGTVGAAAEALRTMGDGLLVERMVDGAVAELLVGVTRDAVFGLVLTIGAGGILTELLRDSRVLLWPATGDEIRSALRQLRLFPLLDGYRGRPKADIDAAVSAIEGIGAFAAAARPAILELEVNPLIVCARGAGAFVADVLMVREDER